jgi:hypothetical protein
LLLLSGRDVLSHCVVVVKKENGARARMPNNKTRRQGFAASLVVFTSFSNAKQKELHTAKKLHKCHNKQSDGFFFSHSKNTVVDRQRKLSCTGNKILTSHSTPNTTHTSFTRVR